MNVKQIEAIKEQAIKLYKATGFKSCIGSVEKVIGELLNPVIELQRALEADTWKPDETKEPEVEVKPKGIFVGNKKIGEFTQQFTLEQVEEILKNMGHDITCGSCMEVAFTGGGSGYDHTCKPIKVCEDCGSTDDIKETCDICGSTDEHKFDNPACDCLGPQTFFEVNEIPEKITDIFNHLDTNTYVLSCYPTMQDLYRAMRMDLETLRVYVERTCEQKPAYHHMIDPAEEHYIRIALESIEVMCGDEFQVDDLDKFKQGIYRAAHTALGTCNNKHEEWKISIQALWDSFDKAGVL